jgi:predicted CxxxxCH...CXXCH cytochrome family protein
MTRRCPSSLTVAAALSLGAALAAGCGDAARIADIPDTSGSVALATCARCHGDPANGNAAPPVSVRGETATTAIGVGAHQAHLQDGPLHLALPCASCHVVPTREDQPGHIAGPTAALAFGALATTGGAAPSWDRQAQTCSNVYCHGATLAGGSHTAPRWTNVGAGEAACGSCHGLPPTNPRHPKITATDTRICSTCHPGTVKPDGTIDVAGGLHVDGIVEAGGTCTACHGDPKRTPQSIAPAPPRDPDGNTDTASIGVGAHQAHLTSPLTTPLACADCHVVPSSTDSHPSGTVNVTFGARATANGAAAAWRPAGPTCASTWCHGSKLAGGSTTEPVWTKVDGSQKQCGSCHGAPPPTGQHARHVNQGIACSSCHGAGYSSTSVNRDTHVNGTIDVTNRITSWNATTGACVGCHGANNWFNPSGG